MTELIARPLAVEAAVVLPKPVWRGWMHLAWFEASLVVGTILVLRVRPDHRPAALIYACTVAALFGSSALYHRGSWSVRTRAALARLDHSMILVLIAGTATPLCLVSVGGTTGTVMLAAMWAVAVFALVSHLLWRSVPEIVAGSTYVGVGCLGGAALPAVWTHSGVAAFLLILLGGLTYILGAVLFHRRRPDPLPDVFGFHEVFHCCVCAAATAQYIAIALLIL